MYGARCSRRWRAGGFVQRGTVAQFHVGYHFLIAVGPGRPTTAERSMAGNALSTASTSRRIHVEPRADDHLLEPPDHEQRAVGVQLAEVAARVPAALRASPPRSLPHRGSSRASRPTPRIQISPRSPAASWREVAGSTMLQLRAVDHVARRSVLAPFAQARQMHRARVFRQARSHGAAPARTRPPRAASAPCRAAPRRCRCSAGAAPAGARRPTCSICASSRENSVGGPCSCVTP